MADIGKAPTNSTPENPSRREFLRTAGALTIASAFSVVSLPADAVENVTQATRKKVEAVKKEFPNFKLSPDAQACIDNKLIDTECDPTINDEVDIHQKKQQVNAKEQQVNAKEQQVNAEKQQNNIMKAAIQNIDIVIGLVQLGLYIDYQQIPSKDADYMSIVMSNPETPQEVRSIFEEFLRRKKSGGTFTWKADGQRLINLAKKHLEMANILQSQLTDKTFKKQASALYTQAATSYTMAEKMLSQKV